MTPQRYKRDELKRLNIQSAALFVCLDGLAKADRQFLRGVACDPLGGIRHERIGDTHVNYGINEFSGNYDAGIHNNGKAFNITHLLNEFLEQGILHLIGDESVTQQTAVYSQRSMQGI